jgi:acyl-CoA thioesterase
MMVPGSGHASSVTGGAPITALFPVNADGVSPAVLPPSGGGSRGFGGHVAAVTLAAAYATVPPGLSVRHVHVEFLRPAISGRPLRASVRSFRDGRTVGRRFVEVAHDGEPPCAIATATFHRRDDHAPEHQPPTPAAPDVAEVPLSRTDPVEIRRVADAADPARQQTELRARRTTVDGSAAPSRGSAAPRPRALFCRAGSSRKVDPSQAPVIVDARSSWTRWHSIRYS